MLKKYLQVIIFWLLDISGANLLFLELNRKKALIIWYHGICDEDFDLLNNYDERHIPKSMFCKQLKYLKKHGFHFASMTELADAVNNKQDIGKWVVLTFDDGFNNVIENAYPIMKKVGAKGCFYLVSDLVDTNELLWTDYVETLIRYHDDFRFMFKGAQIVYTMDNKKSYEHAMKDIKKKLRTLPEKERLEHLKQFSYFKIENAPKEFKMANWKQINELDPVIFEIGSHTRRHPNCNNLDSDDELIDEIYNSKVKIENITSRKVDHFCYPAGSYNDKVVSIVKKYGYKSAVTTDIGFVDGSSDLFTLQRVEVKRHFIHFKANISGSYNLLRSIKNSIIRF